jgi:hypothetical protein
VVAAIQNRFIRGCSEEFARTRINPIEPSGEDVPCRRIAAA